MMHKKYRLRRCKKCGKTFKIPYYVRTSKHCEHCMQRGTSHHRQRLDFLYGIEREEMEEEYKNNNE